MQDSAENLLDSDGFSTDFENTLLAELKRFKTPVKVKKVPRLNGRFCIQFFAVGLTMQKISDELKKAKYDEIEVHVQQILVINTSVTLPGKNLVLVCPNIKITTKVAIDLSGKNALPIPTKKAKNGTNYGGRAGKSLSFIISWSTDKFKESLNSFLKLLDKFLNSIFICSKLLHYKPNFKRNFSMENE